MTDYRLPYVDVVLLSVGVSCVSTLLFLALLSASYQSASRPAPRKDTTKKMCLRLASVTVRAQCSAESSAAAKIFHAAMKSVK